MAKKHDRTWWTRVVDEYERGGLSARAFCAKRGLVLGTFQSWLYEVRKQRRAAEPVQLVRVEVRDDTSAAPTSPVEIDLASGARIRVAVGTDVLYVAALAVALERASC